MRHYTTSPPPCPSQCTYAADKAAAAHRALLLSQQLLATKLGAAQASHASHCFRATTSEELEKHLAEWNKCDEEDREKAAQEFFENAVGFFIVSVVLGLGGWGVWDAHRRNEEREERTRKDEEEHEERMRKIRERYAK